MNPKSIKSLVGLELGARRMVAVEVRRAGAARVEVRKTIQVGLSLDPLTGAPELVGREIRNYLNDAGIKARHCIVSLPLAQVLTYQTALPAMAEEDVASFLELEAEHAFPFDPEDLSIATSRLTEPDGARKAMLTAVSMTHILALENVLRHAGLKPVSITLGTAALVENLQAVEGIIARTESGVELLVAAGGGIAALRMLGEPAVAGEREESLDTRALVREARITIGRLPRSIRESLKTIRVFGPTAQRRALLQALDIEMESMGIALETAGVDNAARIDSKTESQVPAGVTLAAARWLAGIQGAPEYLPPRISRFVQMSRRMMAGGLLWKLGSAAAAIALIVGGAFGWQSYRLATLTENWRAIEPEVTRLEAISNKIRTYRAWYDDQPTSLVIARGIAEAFPEEGSVWTRQIIIREQASVTLTGYARTYADYNAVFDALNGRPGVKNLVGGPIRGEKPPLQFSISYAWQPGGAR